MSPASLPPPSATRPMRLTVLSFVFLLTLSPGVAAQDFAGDWSGTLATPNGSLAFVLHLTPEADGYAVTADSPDQGITGLPGSAEASGDEITVRFPAVGGTYVARLDGDTLAGTFSQGGGEFPLTLQRGASGAEAVAPQTVAPEASLAALVGDWEGVVAGALPVALPSHRQAPRRTPSRLRSTARRKRPSASRPLAPGCKAAASSSPCRS